MERAEVAQLAAEIAADLVADGLPVIGSCECDAGHKAAFAIQLPDGREWAFRVPVENLSKRSVGQMVEAYL